MSPSSLAQIWAISLAISFDTWRDQPSAVLKAITRTGELYWPSSNARTTVARSVSCWVGLPPAAAKAPKIIQHQIDISVDGIRDNRGVMRHDANSTNPYPLKIDDASGNGESSTLAPILAHAYGGHFNEIATPKPQPTTMPHATTAKPITESWSRKNCFRNPIVTSKMSFENVPFRGQQINGRAAEAR